MDDDDDTFNADLPKINLGFESCTSMGFQVGKSLRYLGPG